MDIFAKWPIVFLPVTVVYFYMVANEKFLPLHSWGRRDAVTAGSEEPKLNICFTSFYGVIIVGHEQKKREKQKEQEKEQEQEE